MSQDKAHDGGPGAASQNIALTSLAQPSDDRSRTSDAGDGEVVSHPAVVYPTGLTFYLIVLTISLTLILGGLDLNVVATAVPAITDHFHTVADVGWYSAAYRLMACSFQFLFGKKKAADGHVASRRRLAGSTKPQPFGSDGVGVAVPYGCKRQVRVR